jgi:hypothetical protein
MRKLSGNARCGAAVKADAYGTGADHAAPRLAREGCRDFFVADANEGRDGCGRHVAGRPHLRAQRRFRGLVRADSWHTTSFR